MFYFHATLVLQKKSIVGKVFISWLPPSGASSPRAWWSCSSAEKIRVYENVGEENGSSSSLNDSRSTSLFSASLHDKVSQNQHFEPFVDAALAGMKPASLIRTILLAFITLKRSKSDILALCKDDDEGEIVALSRDGHVCLNSFNTRESQTTRMD